MKILILVLVTGVGLMGCAHGMTQYMPKEIGNDYCSVNIMRRSNIVGSPTAIILDKRIIAHLGAGEYITFPLKSGIHTLSVKAGAYNTLELNYDFEPNCIKYFLVSPGWSSRIELEELSQNEGLNEIKHYQKLKEERQ